jgi:hypothetical protein
VKRRQKPSITGTVSSAYLRLFNRNRWSYNRLSILLVMGRSRANPLPEANLCRLACTSSFDRRRLEMMRSVDSRSIRIVRVFHGLYTVPTRPLQGPLHHSHRIHCPLGAKQGPSRGQAGAKQGPSRGQAGAKQGPSRGQRMVRCEAEKKFRDTEACALADGRTAPAGERCPDLAWLALVAIGGPSAGARRKAARSGLVFQYTTLKVGESSSRLLRRS